jgi:hypothetical protein
MQRGNRRAMETTMPINRNLMFLSMRALTVADSRSMSARMA